MDIKENVLTSIQQKKYNFKILKLEANLRYVKSQLETLQESCSHDLILHLGSEKPNSGENDFAICVICGKKFNLHNYLDEANQNINSEKILSVVDFIPEKYRYKIVGKEQYNFLVLRVQEKLEQLSMSNTNYSDETLKTIIAGDLYSYIKEYEQKEEKKLAMIRKLEK